MAKTVRVRFAPSPTGYLHVGSLRAALYNYLLALRIEDTDQTRYVEGATESLIQTLKWAGLTYEEGPEVGGPHGSYYQSQRTDLYREAIDRLLEAGQAYPCFCTAERLEQMRHAQQKAKGAQKYDRACLELTRGEIESRKAAGVPFVVRMRIPDHEIVAVDDLVRGHVEFSSEMIDDQVLLKSDGFPTYHLANVVDDHLMQIFFIVSWGTRRPPSPISRSCSILIGAS